MKAKVKFVVANKEMGTRLNKAASLVQRLKAKDEKVQQFKREANTAAMASDSLSQELKLEQERYSMAHIHITPYSSRTSNHRSRLLREEAAEAHKELELSREDAEQQRRQLEKKMQEELELSREDAEQQRRQLEKKMQEEAVEAEQQRRQLEKKMQEEAVEARLNLVTEKCRLREEAEQECRQHSAKLREQGEAHARVQSDLQKQIEDARAVLNPVHVADVLGVSPNSMKKVKAAAKKGSLVEACRAPSSDGDTPTDDKARNRFHERIASSLTPSVTRICSMPKFGQRSKPDAATVAEILLKRIKKMRKKKPRRRRLFGIGKELKSFLQEMGKEWRAAFRNYDRATADTLLQCTLKAIPKRSGYVAQWLGPEIFNEELPVAKGSPVRLLEPQKKNAKNPVRFRNGYLHSKLGKCVFAVVHCNPNNRSSHHSPQLACSDGDGN